MMRWGRKKPGSSGSSSSSRLSRALPVSWLSKFKRMNVAGSDFKPAKEKKQDEPWQNMSARSLSRRDSERHDCDTAAKVSVWYESVGELDFPATSFQTCVTNATRLTAKEMGKEMINKVQKKRREFHRAAEDVPDMDAWDREKGTVIMTPRLKFDKDEKKWVRNDHRLLEQKLQRSEQEEKDTEVNAAKSAGRFSVSSMNGGSDNKAILGDANSAILGHSQQTPTYQWQKLKEAKLSEVKLKVEQQRKSLYASRPGTKQNSGGRVFSPRASSRTEKCRVKAIEDLKKAKLRTREHKERAARGMEKESFAVVKCSCDPQRDFRDSMIEMITENRINRPEELKELLVCYLTLNTDEYHELIIKVFREVWVDLKNQSYNAEAQSLSNSSF